MALAMGCGGGESFEVSDDSDGAVDGGDDASSGDGSADSDLTDSSTVDSADDTGASADSAIDSTTTDSGTTDTDVDSGMLVDSGALDSGAGDTGAADTGIGDTGIGDTGIGDTGIGDTGPGDTGIGETATDAGCAPGSSQSCYGGAASDLTAPSTACRAGIQYCIGGTFGPCIGEVRPSPESCNNIDDDCNGSIDDGLGTISCSVGACANTVPACTGGKPSTCTPKAASAEVCGNAIDEDCDGVVNACGCVYVAPTGTAADNALCGTNLAPCKTIQYAINKAGTASATGTWPTQVCVA
ncbi:MAG: MopE-related protein, partial [Polyangiales bacterium]